MAAEPNNKYAETVTREAALELANKAIEAIDDDCYFLSEVAEKCDTYRLKFMYLLQKFNEDDEVKDLLERMYNKCESILVRKAATNKINAILGIFILKSYHNLVETNKTQHEFDASNFQNAYKKAISSNEQSES